MNLLNAFTVDVEDYYHVHAFSNRVDSRRWDDYQSRVVANTHRILRMLDEHQVRGTFFVLGWVADRFPRLVRDIHRSGHEIGCHGFWHRLIYRMTREDFHEDLLLGSKAIEDVTGQQVVAFRAPSFSITGRSLWALDVLMEEGYQFDSSIFPVRHDNYGVPKAERFPHRIRKNGKSLWEFPPSVYRFWKGNVPIAGGGYFRLYPVGWTNRFLAGVNQNYGRPFVFYIHPWELDPDQPRLKAGSWKSRARHYLNLKSTEQKLDILLRSHRFGPLSEAIRRLQQPEECPMAGQTARSVPSSGSAGLQEYGPIHNGVKVRVSLTCAQCPLRHLDGNDDGLECAARVFELIG